MFTEHTDWLHIGSSFIEHILGCVKETESIIGSGLIASKSQLNGQALKQSSTNGGIYIFAHRQNLNHKQNLKLIYCGASTDSLISDVAEILENLFCKLHPSPLEVQLWR